MSQFAGWLAQHYRVNRPLSDYERISDVSNFDASGLKPIDQGIIDLNPVFVEYVDRHFLYRGWGAMWGSLIVAMAFTFALAMIRVLWEVKAEGVRVVAAGDYYAVGFVVILSLGAGAFAYWMLLGRDVFRYQYYPIRFNRVTRVVHIFTGGKQGAISVPWDDIHFVIGRDKPIGPDESSTYDLRGHVMRGDQIIHTFAVGSDSGSSPGVTLAHWEMIRRYMNDGGMDALPFPPLQLFMSITPSFRNAFIIHVSSAGKGLMLLALPITLPWALFRYLTMKLCRKPQWPESVEEACQPGSKQPGALQAPAVYGRVKRGGPKGDAMLSFWKDAIKEAKARDPELRAHLYGRTPT
jgi:hypothetical protein